MSDKQTVDASASAPSLFALHHLTSLALVMLGLGLFAFIILAGEMLEGDTMRFDRWLLMALRTPGDPSDPIGPLWADVAWPVVNPNISTPGPKYYVGIGTPF